MILKWQILTLDNGTFVLEKSHSVLTNELIKEGKTHSWLAELITLNTKTSFPLLGFPTS
jgi:hypothetical protein